MVRQVKHLTDDSVVVVEVSGQISQDDLVETFTAGITTAQEHCFKRILIDAREVTITSSATQLYSLPKLLHEQGLTRAHKVAILFSGDSEASKDLSFLETIFFNRGFPMRLFAERAEAMKWLKRERHRADTKAQSAASS